LKKSFLTWAILALFFVNSFSFLTYADDTLFSIEWMNMSQYWWWSSWDLEAILTRLAERWLLWWGWTWTWWTWWNWVYYWDWTWFSYAEKKYTETTQEIDSDKYAQWLNNQKQLLQSSWSYSSVESVDLDWNWYEEIVTVSTWWEIIIYEWSWTSFKWSNYYWFEKTNASDSYFLRLEDDTWKQVYYLIKYSWAVSFNSTNNMIRWCVYSWNRVPDWFIQRVDCPFPSYNNIWWIKDNQSLDESFGNWNWVCMTVTVDWNWMHYSDRFKNHCWRTWYTCTWHDLCNSNETNNNFKIWKTVWNWNCSFNLSQIRAPNNSSQKYLVLVSVIN